MNVRDKFAEWFGKPAQPVADPAQPLPATVVLRETPRGKITRGPLIIGGGILLLSLWMVSRSGEKAVTVPAAGASVQPATTDTRRVGEVRRNIEPPKVNPDIELRRQEVEMSRGGEPVANDPLYPGSAPPPQTPAQTATEQERERLRKSLFSSPVVLVAPARELPPVTPVPQRTVAAQLQPAPLGYGINPEKSPEKTSDCEDIDRGGERLYSLCEGTIIDARTENRLVGEFSGPVKAFTSSDTLSRDGQHLLLPKGTVVLGNANGVSQTNQRRIAVTFHRLILPDGRGVALDQVPGLDQAGETALAGKTNRHLMSTFGTAAVIGALAGFSQFGAGSVYTGGGIDTYRQGVASSMGQSGQQILQRDLNRMPTITIPEGKAIEIYLTADLHLREFKALEAK